MKQYGFTLLEILVVVAIMGLIAPLLAMSIRQIVVRTDSNVTSVTALRPLENAARWLGEDIPVAQYTDLASSTPSSTLTLYWTDWADSSNYDFYSSDDTAYKRIRYTYALVAGDLKRTVATCGNQDGSDLRCVNQIVSGAGWQNGTNWVDGEPVLEDPDNDGVFTFNTGSRVPDPGGDRLIALNVSEILFSRTGDLITVTLTSDPKGTGQYAESATLKILGSLLSAESPF